MGDEVAEAAEGEGKGGGGVRVHLLMIQAFLCVLIAQGVKSDGAFLFWLLFAGIYFQYAIWVAVGKGGGR